jgi:hypothetical protein
MCVLGKISIKILKQLKYLVHWITLFVSSSDRKSCSKRRAARKELSESNNWYHLKIALTGFKQNEREKKWKF